MPGGHDGLYRGMVTDIDDPEGLNRVRLMVPQLFGRSETGWAWPSQPAEITSLPAVGGVVWVLFEAGHQDRPVWVGTWSVSVRPVNAHDHPYAAPHDHPYVAKTGDTMTGALTASSVIVQIPNGKLPADLIGTYPDGISTAAVTSSNGWPTTGAVLTVKQEAGTYSSQTLTNRTSSVQPQVFTRKVDAAGAWSPWATWVSADGIPRAGIIREADTGITNATSTTLDADTLLYENGVTVSLPNGRLTIVTAGLYQVSSQWVWGSNSTGRRRGIVLLNDAESTRGVRSEVQAQSNTSHGGSLSITLAVGDTLRCQVYQDSGASLDILRSALHAVWVAGS